jgi:hypothetical protein
VQDEDIAFGFTAYNPGMVEEEERYRALESRFWHVVFQEDAEWLMRYQFSE